MHDEASPVESWRALQDTRKKGACWSLSASSRRAVDVQIAQVEEAPERQPEEQPEQHQEGGDLGVALT
jgi:hypothetical protein